MAQLFPPRANILVRATLVGAGAVVVALPVALWAFARTPPATGQYVAIEQPIAFSHPLHVNGLRIDCRYCHAGAERGPMAGLPPTTSCVPCHKDGYLASPLFRPITESLATGRPIPWRRVTDLPDFVFFHHAVHVRNGIGCETCHGPVHLMPQVYQAMPMTMDWCMECHRQPREMVAAQSEELRRLTSCTTCHR